MNATEKWSLIVSNVEKKLSAKENEVQQLWENLFSDTNFFGYSKFIGEIDSQRAIHIGSYERTIPDIIIRDAERNKDLFVVELKQHNLPFDTKYKEQLFSYMRLLRLNVGVLICNKIYLYILDHDDNEISMEIAFQKENANGGRFIEQFSKNSYDENAVRQFIEKELTLKSHVQEIREDLQSLSLLDLIKEHYAARYSAEEIEIALCDWHESVNLPSKEYKSMLSDISLQNKQRAQYRACISSSEVAGYYDEPEDIDYMIIKTSQERVDLCHGSMYEATRHAWKLNVEHARRYRYVLGVIKGIVCGVYCVEKWCLVTEGDGVGRYEFFGYDAPNNIANRFLGKRIPPQYSKPGSASPVLYKVKSL